MGSQGRSDSGIQGLGEAMAEERTNGDNVVCRYCGATGHTEKTDPGCNYERNMKTREQAIKNDRLQAIADAVNRKVVANGIDVEKPYPYHSGGGIWGIMVPLGNDLEAFFGTADECWGADLMTVYGDLVGWHLTVLPSDEQDLERIADTIFNSFCGGDWNLILWRK